MMKRKRFNMMEKKDPLIITIFVARDRQSGAEALHIKDKSVSSCIPTLMDVLVTKYGYKLEALPPVKKEEK